MIRKTCLTAAVAGALLAGAVTLVAQTPRPASVTANRVQATIDDLAWIAGRWRSEVDGARLEEQWNEPLGNNMIGMFRWVRAGAAWVYEFMMIEQRPKTGIVFHLRHFGPGCVAWEDRDEPFTYPLVKLTDSEAVFENPERDHPRRFIYRRDGADRLVIRLEGYETKEDGTKQPGSDEFRFERASAVAP